MIIFNYHIKNYIEIEEGEELCPKCKGKGRVNVPSVVKFYNVTLCCDKCLGDGKIDWLEKVTGKKPRHIYS